VRRVLLQTLFCLALWWGVTRCLELVGRLRRRDDRAVFGTVVALALGAVLVAGYLVLYPGLWHYDEFSVLDAAKSFAPYYWQHYFTVVFHSLCLYLVPTGAGIALIQALATAATVGYLVSGVRALLVHKRLAWLLVLPFLLFPAVYEVYHPLRMTMYSVVVLLLLGRLTLLFAGPRPTSALPRTFVEFSLLITLAAFWRTEGIFYLALLPVVAVRLGLVRSARGRSIPAVAALLAGLAVVGAGAAETVRTAQPGYQLTALYNPLSIMLSEHLTGGDVAKDTALIDQVLDVDHMRMYASYSDIPGYWAPGAVRPDYQQHMGSFYRGAVDLIAHNPRAFLAARVHTFLATNSTDGNVPYVPTGEIFSDAQHSAFVAHFQQDNRAAAPIDFPLRSSVARTLLVMAPDGEGLALRPFVWTVIPTLAALCLLFVLRVARRNWRQVLPPAVLLLHAGIVFLSTPTYYFMYWLPVYIVGNFLVATALVRWLDERLARRARPVGAAGR
jgi:hypothetical protein